MRPIVLTQFCAALLAGLIATAMAGAQAGLSAWAAGLCIAVPNALFAWYLARLTQDAVGNIPPESAAAWHKGRERSARFFAAEMVKLGVTVVLMGSWIGLYRAVHPLAFIFGAVVVLKSYFIVYLFRQKHGRS